MNFVFTDNTVSVLDRLQKDLRDLIESLEASKAEGTKQDLTVYAVPQTHEAQGNGERVSGDSPVKGQSPKAPKAPEVTLEEVRKVLVEKARAGKNTAVKALLERFSASSLPEVDPADYADLLEMGRKL